MAERGGMRLTAIRQAKAVVLYARCMNESAMKKNNKEKITMATSATKHYSVFATDLWQIV